MSAITNNTHKTVVDCPALVSPATIKAANPIKSVCVNVRPQQVDCKVPDGDVLTGEIRQKIKLSVKTQQEKYWAHHFKLIHKCLSEHQAKHTNTIEVLVNQQTQSIRSEISQLSLALQQVIQCVLGESGNVMDDADHWASLVCDPTGDTTETNLRVVVNGDVDCHCEGDDDEYEVDSDNEDSDDDICESQFHRRKTVGELVQAKVQHTTATKAVAAAVAVVTKIRADQEAVKDMGGAVKAVVAQQVVDSETNAKLAADGAVTTRLAVEATAVLAKAAVAAEIEIRAQKLACIRDDDQKVVVMQKKLDDVVKKAVTIGADSEMKLMWKMKADKAAEN
jgi:hypothetical protein